MATWAPGDPWPGSTPGGAAAPAWGGYVRLWVRAGIAPGVPWHLGPDPQDRLDDGNVLGGGEIDPGGGFLGDRLWVDLSCDALEVILSGGASAGAGIFSKVDAATVTVRLADPAGIYDPLWSGGPFSYGGRSRLVPGAPVEMFAEVVDPATAAVTRYPLFTGTADSWGEDWVPRPWKREAVLIASDATKTWARYDTPEGPSVGAGDTVAARIDRLVGHYGWPGVVDSPPAPSTRTLAATTLAQPGLELLNRVLDDELGVAYFTPAGHLRWVTREQSLSPDPSRFTFGCQAVDGSAHPVLIDASPQRFDVQLRNEVFAARSGGTSQQARSQGSVDQYGHYPYKRTDLGLADDVQVATWAQVVVELYAFPQIGVDDLTLWPAIDSSSWVVWAAVLSWVLFTDIARVVWAPPDLPDHQIGGDVRVVGFKHSITRARWEVQWQTVAVRPLQLSGIIWTLGPDANDRLDAGYVLA